MLQEHIRKSIDMAQKQIPKSKEKNLSVFKIVDKENIREKAYSENSALDN